MSSVPCECISITIHEIVFKEKKGSDVSAHLFFHAVWVPLRWRRRWESRRQPVMTRSGHVVTVFPLDRPKVTSPRFNKLPTAHWGRGGEVPSRFNLWPSSKDAK